MSTHPTLGGLLHAFFEDYLQCQKGTQAATLRSYRDTLRLFLLFVAARARRKLTRLHLTDLTCDEVLQFLNHLEHERGNCVATRNQRLAALRGFFAYLGERIPDLLWEAQRVGAIPTKRTQPPRTRFMERDEIETVFNQLPSKGAWAKRDRALLLFLYNTGARAQEVADLRAGNLHFGTKPQVHLHGKGDKWRICPLWVQTGALLSELLGSAVSEDSPVFVSRTGQALTRFGIYKIVCRHTAAADADGVTKSPHVFRHTAAVHLLEAGVEVNVIRAWLGHVSLDTTYRYAEINLRMKEQALEICEPPVSTSAEFPRRPIWRDDESLLKWLQSL